MDTTSKICSKCGAQMQIEEGVMTASIPPMYRYHCPNCGELDFDTKKYPTPEVIKETTTIEKIRAEIERLEEMDYPCDNSEQEVGFHFALFMISAFLDTLPEQPVEKTSYDTQKYTPNPWVSIEDVARVQFASHAKVFDKKRAVFDWEQFKVVVSIFYGFGKIDSLEAKEKEQPVTTITKSNALFDKCVENCDPAVMKEVSDNIDKMLASEGLEEEVRKYLSERWKLGCTPITPVCLPNFTTDDLKECAEYFYKLGLINKK